MPLINVEMCTVQNEWRWRGIPSTVTPRVYLAGYTEGFMVIIDIRVIIEASSSSIKQINSQLLVTFAPYEYGIPCERESDKATPGFTAWQRKGCLFPRPKM